jgi:exodeoxyribonuclease III
MQLELYTFNVNGIRAIAKKGFWDWVENIQPGILCLQETKADDSIMAILKTDRDSVSVERLVEAENTALLNLDVSSIQPSLRYSYFWHSCTMKKGYSGTAILVKSDLFETAKMTAGVGNERFDVEGRLTILETEHFVLLNGYFPQGGREGRVSYKIDFYAEVIKKVNYFKSQGKKVIVCGDLNTTVADIDLARPKENRQTTGCLPEERQALNWFFESDLVDVFRYKYPDLAHKYTYWDQISRARERNVGWRIDYFLLDTRLLSNLRDIEILDQVMGSDHCPVKLTLEI